MHLRYLCALVASGLFCAVGLAQEQYPLKKLILADSEQKVTAIQPKDDGRFLVMEGLPLFDGPEFEKAVSAFIGKPIDNQTLNGLANAISEHAKAKDRLIAKVLVPDQRVAEGVLRFAVVLGRYNDFTFKGNQWFSDALLRDRLGIKAGDEVRLSTLEEAINWINTNPFRSVKVLINEIPDQPGMANLTIGVKDVRPFRTAFSVDDTGNELIGETRLTGTMQFGNLWRRDHQGTYQFLTTDKPDIYQGHVIDYRIPLRSRHFLQFSGNYIRLKPTFGGGRFTQIGETIVGNVRYTIPFPRGNEPREAYIGLNFKQSNNDVEFGGENVRSTKTDTFQASAGFSLVKRDKYGAWMLGVNLTGSPGDLNSRNTDETFQSARLLSSARYLYGTLALQRMVNLSYGWELFTRGVFQYSSGNLLANEQLSIGGSGSVRGYEENVFSGDHGFVLNTDLTAPALRFNVPRLSKDRGPMETRFLGFLDMGDVRFDKRIASDTRLAALASTGVGFRSSLGTNFSMSFDYGWQLMHQPRQASMPRAPSLHSRGHLKVVLAF